MASTSAAPSGATVPADDGAAGAQGGIDRDVNSILANLNSEQLASIVAAARASEGGQNGESFATSGAGASSILAALPPGLGQAASALTSLTSSAKKGETDGEEQAEIAAEAAAQAEDVVDGEVRTSKDDGAENTTAESAAADGQPQDAKVTSAANAIEAKEERSAQDGEPGDETKALMDDSVQPADDETGDDYRNENATQAAIAAMESLAAQSGVEGGYDRSTRSGSQSRKRDSGPEADRLRKDQHKEVERKRREQISNGITGLQEIVPGCEGKGINKTAIINAAVRYITELKNNEASNIEKWTLEKLLMDQAMGDLQHQLEHAREENRRFRQELGLPEPEEEPAQEPEPYENEAGAAEGQEQHKQEPADAGAQDSAMATDDANLDPDLAKQEMAAPAPAEDAGAINSESVVAAPGADGGASDAGKVAGRTRDAAEAGVGEETAPKTAPEGRAKRTRHA